MKHYKVLEVFYVWHTKMAEMRCDPLMIFNKENAFVISIETYFINWLGKRIKRDETRIYEWEDRNYQV